MIAPAAWGATSSTNLTVTVAPTGTGPVSADGSKITGGTGQLRTVDGTWTFGAARSDHPGNWDVFLNGASVNSGSTLEVNNGGWLYLFGTDSGWYKWWSKQWFYTNNPVPTTVGSISVDNLNPQAGDTVTISYDPQSMATSASDWIQLNAVGTERSCNVPPGSNGSNAFPTSIATPNATPGPHTAKLRIPMVPSDVPQYWQVEYWGNAQGGIAACQGGGGAFQGAMLVASKPMTVAPTLPAPSYPPAPSYITYPPPGWPAQPNETITVCASGCQFQTLDDAAWYMQYQDTNHDWIKIDVSSGTYYTNQKYNAWGYQGICDVGNCAKHVWIYGHGPTRPVITCIPDFRYSCAGVIAPPGLNSVIDNIEVAHTIRAGANSAGFGGVGCQSFKQRNTFLLRNAYIHDGGQGMLGGGECAYDMIFQNSHFARFGGPVGPAHDVYFNDFAPGHWEGTSGFPAVLADGHLVLDHSVFELVDSGHSVKSHANRLDANCSILTSGTAETYSGSQALDLDGGGGQVTITNSLIVGGAYLYNWQANSSWFMEFGGDKSSWDGDQPSQFIVVDNSHIFNDRGQFMLNLNAPMQPSQPYTWSNNVFVGPWDDSYTQAACAGSIPCKTPVSTFPVDNPSGRPADVNFGCSGSPQSCLSLRDTGTGSHTGNLFFTTRAQARAHNWPSAASPIQDLPTRTDNGGTVYTAWPYDPKLYPMPPACTDPVGNVQWPTN